MTAAEALMLTPCAEAPIQTTSIVASPVRSLATRQTRRQSRTFLNKSSSRGS